MYVSFRRLEYTYVARGGKDEKVSAEMKTDRMQDPVRVDA